MSKPRHLGNSGNDLKQRNTIKLKNVDITIKIPKPDLSMAKEIADNAVKEMNEEIKAKAQQK